MEKVNYSEVPVESVAPSPCGEILLYWHYKDELYVEVNFEIDKITFVYLHEDDRYSEYIEEKYSEISDIGKTKTWEALMKILNRYKLLGEGNRNV